MQGFAGSEGLPGTKGQKGDGGPPGPWGPKGIYRLKIFCIHFNLAKTLQVIEERQECPAIQELQVELFLILLLSNIKTINFL